MLAVPYRRFHLRALLGVWLVALACLLVDGAYGQDGVTPNNADTGIALSHDGAQDARITSRINEIFGALGGLDKVEVSVSEGVVTLAGQVDAAADEARALALAGQVQGVVSTINRLEVNQALGARIDATWAQLASLVKSGIGALPLIAAALMVIAGFFFLSRWVGARQAFFRRIIRNPFVATLAAQFSQLAVLVVGFLLALVLLDATAIIGTLLGAAGIFGLALGFATRDTVENYIASLLLSLRNPFEMNDLVSVDGHEGTVARMTTRATVLISADGNHIRIPNATVFKAVITNYTRHPERRFSFELGVDTDLDLLEAQSVAMETLEAMEGVLDAPAPMVVVDAIGDSNVVLTVHGWVNQREYSFVKVRSEAIRAVKQAFDAAGIVMPEPIYKLRLDNATAATLDASTPTPDAGADVKADVEAVAAARRRPTPRRGMQNVKADRTIESRVEADARHHNEENLLDPAAPAEL